MTDLFRTDIPQIDKHLGGILLIHGPKHRKDNQLRMSISTKNNICKLSFLIPQMLNIYVWCVTITNVVTFMDSLNTMADSGR